MWVTPDLPQWERFWAEDWAYQFRCYLGVDEHRQYGHDKDRYDDAGYPRCRHIQSLLLRLGSPQHCSIMLLSEEAGDLLQLVKRPIVGSCVC